MDTRVILTPKLGELAVSTLPMDILNRLAGIFRQKPVLHPTVRVTDVGIEVIRGDERLASVRWSDAKRIITYKYDNWAVDEICIGFLTAPDADSWVEISEEWPGFAQARETMERQFPSIRHNWFADVAIPAFKRNETVIWEAEHAAAD